MALFVHRNQGGKTVVRVLFLLDEVFSQFLGNCLNFDYLSFNQTIHRIHVFLYFVQTFVDGRHSVKFVLCSAEDAIGTQQLLLCFAVNRDIAVVL